MRVKAPQPTTGTDIIPLADMKEFLRVDFTDEDDLITALMDSAVAHCTDYTGKHFTPASTAFFYLERWRPATLAFGPVKTIESVKYYDTSGVQQTLSTSKYYNDSISGRATRIYFHDVPDLEDYNSTPITIECTVGESATPNIKHAIRMLVAHWYENRRAVITTTPQEMPLGVRALLNPERIIDLGQ